MCAFVFPQQENRQSTEAAFCLGAEMARKRKAQIPGDIRDKVLKRDGYRCRYCGSGTGTLHMDHVYPESKGGETTISNLVTACARCNTKKSYQVGMWPKPLGYWDEHDAVNAKHQKELAQLETKYSRITKVERDAAVMEFINSQREKPDMWWRVLAFSSICIAAGIVLAPSSTFGSILLWIGAMVGFLSFGASISRKMLLRSKK